MRRTFYPKSIVADLAMKITGGVVVVMTCLMFLKACTDLKIENPLSTYAAEMRACCTSRPSPTACRVVMADGMVWYGPTCDVARARERWYADPSWRVAANIPTLGYGR